MRRTSRRTYLTGGLLGGLLLAAACAEQSRIPSEPPAAAAPAQGVSLQLDCRADLATGTLSCGPSAVRAGETAPRDVILGGQHLNVRMISACVRTDNDVLSADVAVQNLLAQPMGTRDGSTASGVTVFFHTGPTDGVTVANAQGTGRFTAPDQPFFHYPEMLAPGEVSASQRWRFDLNGQSAFRFSVLLHTRLPDEREVVALAPPVNRPPTACISVPADEAEFAEGEEITFRGTASDPEEGALSGEQLVWSSDRDGVLGTGTEISRSDLSAGPHLISLTATDAQGLEWTSSVRINIVALVSNQPPTAEITTPPTGSSFEQGTSVSFSGSATDPEDGELTGDALVWTSSLDSEIGTGESFTRDDLSPGEHVITLTATDSEGLTGTATVEITITEEPVPNQPPVVEISSPADGAEFSEGVSILFEGSAVDPEDGELTGDALVWTSSLDGEIGTGTSVTRSDLSLGPHVITLTATDSEGLTGSASVTIHVLAAPPPPPPSLVPSTISTGTSHSCGLTESGAAYCWGTNTFGQLGDGTTTRRLTPSPVTGGLQFGAVSAGDRFTCAITTDNEPYCWGVNLFGSVGDGTGTGARANPTAVAGGLRFTSIAAGGLFACGVTDGGQAYCWGLNLWGNLGDGTTEQRNAPVAVVGRLSFVGISAGGTHSCGVEADGEVYCWGNNAAGQIGDGTQLERHVPTAVVGGLRFAIVSAGDGHTCAITPQSDAYCWGRNISGQIGDGTILNNRLVPTAVFGGLRFATVSAGGGYTCGVTTGEEGYCWGTNIFGQLGDGTTTRRPVPTAVAGELSFTEIATSLGVSAHSCGKTADGGAYCWGNNATGQLGDGTTTQRLTPTPVSEWGDLAAIPFIGKTLYALVKQMTSPAAVAMQRTAG